MNARADDLTLVLAVVTAASTAGSPVAGRDEASQRELAAVALRRWGSYERRAKRSTGKEHRVEDLAKGLRDAFEADRSLVGPLMTDYRWLAERIAKALGDGG